MTIPLLNAPALKTGELTGDMLSANNTHATRDGIGAIIAAAGTKTVKTDGSLVVFTFRVKAAGRRTNSDPRPGAASFLDIDGEARSLSYSLPALIVQGSGSDSGSGSGSDAEKPGTDDKKSEDDKKY